MLRESLVVQAGNGRRLMVEVEGSLEDPAVFFLHGTPGSRRLFPFFVAMGKKRGICHVSYSRPGYEGSDRYPGRAVVDCGEDVAAIADTLGMETFYVFGESAGGPHALAAAALLGGRIRGVALMCSSGPYSVAEFDWAEGMAPECVEEDSLALDGEAALRPYLEDQFDRLRAVENSSQLVEFLGGITSPVDRDTYENEMEDHGLFVWREVAKTGFWGWLDDDLALVGDWGFSLDRVGTRVAIWHGRSDLTIPFAHAEWLTAHLPNARLQPLPDVGHNSIFTHYGPMLEELLAG